MTPSQTIEIRVGNDDITHLVDFRNTTFSMQANPIQGSHRVVVRDIDHTFNPNAGSMVSCHLDGVPIYGGYNMAIERGFYFPAQDTAIPSAVARRWTLSGPDFNFLFDKRVLRDLQNPYRALSIPNPNRTITKAFRYMMQRWLDVPSALDWTTYIDKISTAYGSTKKGALLIGQGKTWRDQMEDFANHGALVYYIDAAFRLHMHEYETATIPWFFSDYKPDGVTTVGFREAVFTEDFSQAVTEALVWGGSTIKKQYGGPGGNIVFAKYPQAPANNQVIWQGTESQRTLTAAKEQEALQRRNQYGRWQMAEEHAGKDNYLTLDSVRQRAYNIINGPTGDPPTHGLPSGFNQPLESMTATWFGHDVPNGKHIVPGFLVDFTLYTQNKHFTLPCRSITVTFPTRPNDAPGETYVRFDGEFGVSYSDRRYLWKAMRKRRAVAPRTTFIAATVDSSSTEATPNSYMELSAIEVPDGVLRTFTFPQIFYVGEFTLYLNGLAQRSGIDYTYDADAGSATFAVPPGVGDQIWAEGYGGQ